MTGRNEGLWTATRCSWLNQGGTTELLKPPSLGVGMEAFLFEILEVLSHSVLCRVPPRDVPVGYASVVPLPAALLEDILSSLTRIREVKS